MKNSKQGFIVPLLVVIIAVLVIGGGLYVYKQNQIMQPVSIIQQTSTTTPTPTQTKTPTPTPTPSENISVTGMKKYTDTNFGFSFWYPSGWNVVQVTVPNKNVYLGGMVIKELDVSDGEKNNINIQEFVSPTFSITDNTGVGACPVCTTMHYYFDLNIHTWMIQFPGGSESGTYNGKPYTTGSSVPANISFNTMGGLHMFAGSQRFGANSIVPLSATHFVVVQVDPAIATGSSDPQALTKTIVALDPSVATPVSVTEQKAVIQAEADEYNIKVNNPTQTPVPQPTILPTVTQTGFNLVVTSVTPFKIGDLPRVMSFGMWHPIQGTEKPIDTSVYSVDYGDGVKATMTYGNVACPVEGGESCMVSWSAPHHTFTKYGTYTAIFYKDGVQIGTQDFILGPNN